jgi:4-hydroxy-2-oxoglutarate aldolase
MTELPRGILPPIVTPFREDAFDRPAFLSNLERWNGTRLAGYVVLGSNGEAVYLADDEAIAAVEAAAEAKAPGKLLVAGSGREATRQAIAFTLRVARAGAEAVLVKPPAYYRSAMSEAALEAHYRALADASPVPVILYHVPKFVPVTFSVSLVLSLAEHPNIAGIKETSGDIAFLTALLEGRPPGFRVYAGTANLLLAALAAGADGGILALANIAPESCVSMLELVERGDLEAARRLQYRLLAVNQAVTARFGIAGLKRAMDLLGYRGGLPRSPLLPLRPEEEAELVAVLRRAELLPAS